MLIHRMSVRGYLQLVKSHAPNYLSFKIQFMQFLNTRKIRANIVENTWIFKNFSIYTKTIFNFIQN